MPGHADIYNSAKMGAVTKLTTSNGSGNIIYLSLINKNVNPNPVFPILFGIMATIDGLYIRQLQRIKNPFIPNSTVDGLTQETPISGEPTQITSTKNNPVNAQTFFGTATGRYLFEQTVPYGTEASEYDYGSFLPKNTLLPIMVSSFQNETVAIDQYRTTTDGKLFIVCLSTLDFKKIADVNSLSPCIFD